MLTLLIFYYQLGEEPLAQDTSTTGVSTRCLEIEGSGFLDEKQASTVYKIVPNCYGVVGQIFISTLIEKYSPTEYKELQDKLEEIKEKLEKESTSDVSSYISSVSVVTLGDMLVNDWIFKEGTEEDSIKMGISILNSLKRADEIDVVEKAYDYIKSYILSYHSSFGSYTRAIPGYKPSDDVYEHSFNMGIRDGNIYYIYIHKLKELMLKNGYQYHKLVNEFAKRGYILPTYNDDGTIKTATVQKKYRNVNTRFYAFPMEQVNKPIGKERKPLPLSLKEGQVEELRLKGELYFNN